MMSFVFAILVAAAIFKGADAQCYNCTSASLGGLTVGQEGCGEPFNSAGIETVPCPGKCVTISTRTAANSEAGTQEMSMIVLRTCYDTLPTRTPGVPCTDLNNVEVQPGLVVSQTCCMGALCNGGGSDSPVMTPSDGSDSAPTAPSGGSDSAPTTPGDGSDSLATTPSSAGFLTSSAALAVFAPLCAAIF